MHRKLNVARAICALGVLSCGARAPDTSTIVEAALEAQLLYGGGACGTLLVLDTLPITYFAEVTFVRGRCQGEHGDTLSALAGVDRDGVVYVLSSMSSFTFLLRRHPTHIDTPELLDYLGSVLPMIGETYPLDVVLHRGDELPQVTREALGIAIPDTLSVVRSSSGDVHEIWMSIRRKPRFVGMGRYSVSSEGYIVVLSPMSMITPH